MVDLYLQAMMHGDISKTKGTSPPKTEIDKKLDLEIEQYISDQTEETAPGSINTSLTSPEMKRAKLRAEVKESLQLHELSELVETARGVLIRDGVRLMDNDLYADMVDHFANVHAALMESDLKDSSKDFQEILHFDDPLCQAMGKVAIDAFDNKQFTDCLSIFILLTILTPGNAAYWYRAGIAAHQAARFDLAVHFYSTAADLDPENIALYIFKVDCLLKQQKYDEAKSAWELAKILSEKQTIETQWMELLKDFENQIQTTP